MAPAPRGVAHPSKWLWWGQEVIDGHGEIRRVAIPWKLEECDTDDEDGKYRCNDPKDAASATKFFLEEDPEWSDAASSLSASASIVTVELSMAPRELRQPELGQRLVADLMDGITPATPTPSGCAIGASPIGRGSRMREPTGGRCIQVLVAGGTSEMQRAPRRCMARPAAAAAAMAAVVKLKLSGKAPRPRLKALCLRRRERHRAVSEGVRALTKAHGRRGVNLQRLRPSPPPLSYLRTIEAIEVSGGGRAEGEGLA